MIRMSPPLPMYNTRWSVFCAGASWKRLILSFRNISSRIITFCWDSWLLSILIYDTPDYLTWHRMRNRHLNLYLFLRILISLPCKRRCNRALVDKLCILFHIKLIIIDAKLNDSLKITICIRFIHLSYATTPKSSNKTVGSRGNSACIDLLFSALTSEQWTKTVSDIQYLTWLTTNELGFGT